MDDAEPNKLSPNISGNKVVPTEISQASANSQPKEPESPWLGKRPLQLQRTSSTGSNPPGFVVHV
jgi:hypothetical protein